MLRIEINNCNSFIYGNVQPNVFSKLVESLSYKVKNCEFSDKYNTINQNTGKRQWDGRVRLIFQQNDKIRFSSGLLSKVRAILDEHEIEYKIIDSRDKFSRELNIETSPQFEKRPYQEPVILDAIKRGRGIIKVATGGGKTAISAGIIQKLGLRGVLFLSMSGDLVIQTRKEFEKFLTLNGNPLEVGIIGAGYCDIKDINIATAQTICAAFDEKYTKMDDEDDSDDEKITEEILQKKELIRNVVKNSKCIFFDEVQHAACDTVRTIMDRSFCAFYKYGLSASPWRDDGADLYIDAQFGREISDISASFLIANGYLVKAYINLISMPTDSGGFSSYASIYNNYVVNNKKRNDCIAYLANKHAGKNETVLVLVKQINHGKLLEKLIPNSVFVSGVIPAKKREKILNNLRSGETKIVIATSLFDEGIDVKRLNCLIMSGSGKSSTRALQRVGRVLRPFEGKDHATIYDFMDSAKYLDQHARARRKIYRIEEGFEISKMTLEEVYAENC